VPDNDMFEAIRDGRASIVTDQIETFTEKGIKLTSGQELEADIIVTATGLNLQMFGGAELVVDGKPVETGKLWAYRGAMYSDVPNFASVFGYTNASWTLRADLISEYFARLINYMDENNFVQATPRMNLAHPDEKPFVDFSSGYFQRVADKLPKQTSQAPWKQNQSYMHDLMELRYGKLEDGALEFKRAAVAAPSEAKQTVAAE
jgi:cation diffusion facilitator CzcD-associated flavoprotein CzcO